MKGVLLINLGSPDTTETKDVKRYLGEFLMDERVIDVAYWKRYLLIKGIILQIRPKKSGAAYKKIWWDEGSPLVVISERFSKKVTKKVEVPVSLAMRYGSMSMEKGFKELTEQGVDESEIGDRSGRPAKRFKIHMVLRDVLRTPSTGIVETDKTLGLVKYAKPAGVIASLIPMTNPAMTPPVTGVSAANARNAVIFSPHPRTARTTFEMVEVMRTACKAVGAPEDLFQAILKPSIPLTQHLMEICDLTLATGGKPMVKAAYSSGKPAYGVGAGNSSIVIDETADISIAAENTRISKTSDFGSLHRS